MKTTYTTKALLQAWLEQSSLRGKSPSALSFKGRDLYSYDTQIAKILPDGRVLVNVTHYSRTTDRHQRMVNSFLYKKRMWFCEDGLGRGDVLDEVSLSYL